LYTGVAVICRRCGQEIPPNLIACEACTTERAVGFLEAHQLQYLPQVYKGEAALIIVAAHTTRHVQLYGDPYRCFCGAQTSPNFRRIRETYCEATLKNICAACRERLEYLMKEALSGTIPAHPAG
jgi:hypothetical protein